MAAEGIDALKARTGETIGTSDWVTVDQAMIDRFAEATGDHQFIHVDPERARLTPFGGTIAHGFLTLSLLSMLFERSGAPAPGGIRMGVNYGTNKVRFLAPVRSGSRIRGHFKLLGLEEKRPGQYQETIEATIEIEGQDKPALIAEWIFQLFA
jgi:acyl dehydratase